MKDNLTFCQLEASSILIKITNDLKIPMLHCFRLKVGAVFDQTFMTVHGSDAEKVLGAYMTHAQVLFFSPGLGAPIEIDFTTYAPLTLNEDLTDWFK